MLLFDDEGYTLGEDVKRRMVYRPLRGAGEETGAPLFDGAHRPQSVIQINLTEAVMATRGARRWRDLNAETHDMMNIIFNALAFALGKKKRLTTQNLPGAGGGGGATAGARKKRRSALHALATSNAGEDGGGEGEEGGEDGGGERELVVSETDRQRHYFAGGDHLAVVIETLVRHDAHGLRVCGFRWNIFDSSVEGSAGLDLVTQALQESLVEASMMQVEVAVERERNARTLGKKAQQQKSLEIKRHFQFLRINTYPMFLSLAANYFASDDLLWQHADGVPEVERRGEEGEEAAPPPRSPFLDRRRFLQHNNGRGGGGVEGEQQQQSRSDTLASIFSKEQAMVYHVESADVLPHQRELACYYGKTHDEIGIALAEQEERARDPERMLRLVEKAPPDRDFNLFPFPSITYRVDSAFLSNEAMNDVPFPHPVGSYLYTTRDRVNVRRRINEALRERRGNRPGARSLARSGEANIFGLAQEDRDEMEVEADAGGGEEEDAGEGDAPAENVRPLGLHETETEVTGELFHTYAQYVSEDMRRALTEGGGGAAGEETAISPNAKAAFMSRVKNDVRLALLSTMKSLGERKSYLVEVRRPGAAVVAPTGGGGSGALPAVVATEQSDSSQPPRNADKRHALDRRVYAQIGRNANAQRLERQKMLSSRNLAYARSIIAQYRPVAATVENVLKHCQTVKYDVTYLERDIYWVLDCLNEEGFARLDRAHFDPATGKVRLNGLAEYLHAKRLYIEAITIELFHEFLSNPNVSIANKGIRRDLLSGIAPNGGKKTHLGLRMPQSKFENPVRMFHAYMLDLYGYFTEVEGISHHFKTMNLLWHAKYHQARTYAPGSCDPKNNVIQLGQGMVGKSKRQAVVKRSCPTDVCLQVSHWTPQSFNTDDNLSDALMLNDEMSNKLLGPNQANKQGGGNSDGGMDDARNNAKERMTGHEQTTMSITIDEETGARRRLICKAQTQYVTLGASNVLCEDVDPNVLSRFICVSCARTSGMAEIVGQRPQDKNKLELGSDCEVDLRLVEQQREVHRVYYLVECMCKSGILQNRTYGVASNSAQIYITKILDLMLSKYGINTNNIRKRKFVIEMARSMCIAAACWNGLTSPLLRHLQYDPYTHEFIGLNPRLVLDGIVPWLRIGKDEVVMALTTLACLWGHEHEDKVLATLAIQQCHLDDLTRTSFLFRTPRLEGEDGDEATSGATALEYSDRRSRVARYYNPGGGGGGGGDGDNSAPSASYVVDYNYVTMTQKSRDDIHSLLVNSMGDVCISQNEISKILSDLSKSYIQCDGYVMQERQGVRRLVKSPNPRHTYSRKIVDYGKNARNGSPCVAISVAFLKQKLSHLLPDSLVEDLATVSYNRPKRAERAPRGEMDVEGEPSTEVDSDQEDDLADILPPIGGGGEDPEQSTMALHESLQKLLAIAKNASNDTYITKSIREVLEHEILEQSGTQSEAEERADREEYADPVTGKCPWFTLVTADHPPDLRIDQLFTKELVAEYQQCDGANKLIPMVDKLAVLELERPANCRPFVTFNFNTAAPSAKPGLAVYWRRRRWRGRRSRRGRRRGDERAGAGPGGVRRAHRVVAGPHARRGSDAGGAPRAQGAAEEGVRRGGPRATAGGGQGALQDVRRHASLLLHGGSGLRRGRGAPDDDGAPGCARPQRPPVQLRAAPVHGHAGLQGCARAQARPLGGSAAPLH